MSGIVWGRCWRRALYVLAAVVLSLALLASGAVPSRAAEAGWWASDDPGVQSAWAAGIDGSGVTIAVIDTAPIVDNPVLEGADVSYRQAVVTDADTKEPVQCFDGAGQPIGTTMKAGAIVHISATDDEGSTLYTSHGTDMLAAIVGNGTWYDGQTGIRGVAPKTSINFYTLGADYTLGAEIVCRGEEAGDPKPVPQTAATIGQAVDEGARVVNMSFMRDFQSDGYVKDMVKALRHGVIMVEGRANDLEEGLKARVGNPAGNTGFPGSVLVNNIGPDSAISPYSDTRDASVSILSPGDGVLASPSISVKGLKVGPGGTSTATANLSGYLALVIQKWPDATGNQILQSLVYNTKENQGKLSFDTDLKAGFGRVDVQTLLEKDPTQYPDVNPILQMQIATAAKTDWAKDWYTQDCKTNPKGLDSKTEGGTGAMHVPCEASLLKVELERQQTAWKKVEQCRTGKGKDCMRYSATATALAEDGAKPADKSGAVKTDPRSPSASGMPAWVWWCAGGVGAAAVLVGGIVLAVVLSRRRKPAVGGRAVNAAGYPPTGAGSHVPPYGGYARQQGGAPNAYVPRPRTSPAPESAHLPRVPLPPQPGQVPQVQPPTGQYGPNTDRSRDTHGRHTR